MALPFIFRLTLLVTLLSGITACNRPDSSEPRETDDPTANRDLLRSIEWNNGMKAFFTYNADSTIKQTVYTFQTASSLVNFQWSGKQMTELASEESWYTNKYTYNGNGQLAKITNSRKDQSTNNSYHLAFTYHANGSLQKMEYFSTNEAGTKLNTTTNYSYNPDGSLHQAITQTGASIITHTIEGYSPKCNWLKWAFVETGLSENYALYNYAVLAQLDHLPVKIIRTVKTGTEAPYTEKVDQMEYQVDNGRLNGIISQVTYPQMPQSNKSISAVFRYD